MALPTTITVTDSGGTHPIPIPSGWMMDSIRGTNWDFRIVS